MGPNPHSFLGDSGQCGGISHWPVCSVSKLVLVEVWKKAELKVVKDESLKDIHNYKDQYDQSVITEGAYGYCLWNRCECGCFQVGWANGLFQGDVEDPHQDHWSLQVFCACQV